MYYNAYIADHRNRNSEEEQTADATERNLTPDGRAEKLREFIHDGHEDGLNEGEL